MDLRRLRYFVAVAEELNFSRAAERLHIAQPPLSDQIKKLEQDLGLQLFNRTRRSVQLTEAGRLLLEEARRIFTQIEQSTQVVQRVGHGEVGQLAVGFVPSASNKVLPPFLRAFGERFPGVKLFLYELNPDDVLAAVHDRRVDVGFLYAPFEDVTLDAKSISREPFVVALPDTHHLADKSEISLRELAGEPFILPLRYQKAGLYDRILELCREAGFSPKVVQEVWLIQTHVNLVAGGIGVALVPASLQHLQRTGAVYKPIESLAAEVEISAVWRRGDSSPVLREFLKVVDLVARREDSPETYTDVEAVAPGARAGS